MFDLMTPDLWAVTALGLVGGLCLGLAARLGRFCTLGALEDYLYSGSDLRLRMWLVAIGVAVLGLHGLMLAGLFDPAAAGVLELRWNVVGSILGGLMFGYGMAIAGNCGYGALARLGGGDLRSFVIVLVMGISAYATLSGILAEARVWAFPQIPLDAALPTLPALAQTWTGLPQGMVGIIVGLVILGAAFLSPELRAAPASAFWGAVVGLGVVIGWGGTYHIATTGFDAVMVTSHTFSAPVGETILYLMTASGNVMSFAIGSIAGVWGGAFIGSLIKGHFRWEACDDPRELRRQIIGAGLMGVGAVIALGCSIGQGLTAMALLSFSAPVTLAAIFAGAALGLKQLITGFQPTE